MFLILKRWFLSWIWSSIFKIYSCEREVNLKISGFSSIDMKVAKMLCNVSSFNATFIRAPAITEVLCMHSWFCLILIAILTVSIISKYGPTATIIATVPVDDQEIGVAVIQDNILATAFHPELTDDLIWHRYGIFIVNDL